MKFDLSFNRLSKAYASRHEPEQYVVLAQTYWVLLLTCHIFLATVGIGYGSWQFFSPPTSPNTEVASQGAMSFNKEQLKLIVKHFEERQVEFENMMSE